MNLNQAMKVENMFFYPNTSKMMTVIIITTTTIVITITGRQDERN